MPDWLLPASATLGQTGLLVLISVIGLLCVGTLALSVYAVWLRSVRTRSERELGVLKERWAGAVLGAISDPTLVPSVHAEVDADDAVRFLTFVIEFARRVRGEERAVLEELARPFLGLMVSRARARRTEMRAWAVQVLGTLGLPEHGDTVVAALDDPSPLVAMVAARSLARKETPQYAPAVLARLERFREWDRMFLASMLASMGPSVSAHLREGLVDESVPTWTRALMAEAALRQGDFLAGDAAAHVVRTADDRELLASALRLLAVTGRPEHVDVVRPLCSSEDPVIRGQALRAMGSLGGPEDVPVLVEAMGDESSWPALYAARGVRAAGGADVLERLVAEGHERSALARQVLGEEGTT